MKQNADAKSSGSRKTYHHGDLRKVLLDAALAEISAHGAQGLSMASLARRAGVAQSAPYRHFSDREDLLAAVATDGFERFTEFLLEAASDGDDLTALNRMAAAYLVFGERNVELYRLMFASGLVPGAASDSALKRAWSLPFVPRGTAPAVPLPRGEQRGSNGKGGRWGGVSPGLHEAQRRKIGDTPSGGVSALTRTLAGARAEPLALFLFFHGDGICLRPWGHGHNLYSWPALLRQNLPPASPPHPRKSARPSRKTI